MEDTLIENLIAQRRVVTTTDLTNPANDYMVVGVYQNGTNKMKGDGTSYKNYVIPIAELLGGGSAYTASNGVVLIGNDFQLASQNISQFVNNVGYLTAASIGGIAWALDGNTVGSEKFLGTIDNFALPFRVNNNEVMRITADPAGSTRFYFNQTTNFHGSNAGLQYSSDGTSPNRSQARFNLYGANTGAPGITGFKSRGATIGSTLSVLPGDNLFRITSIGVSGNDTSMNLASLIDVRVNQVFAGHVSTDFVVALNSNAGVMTERLYVNSEGNVGIATSTPTTRLHVKGPSDYLGNPIVRIENLSNTAYATINDDGNMYISSSQYTGIQWQVNGAMVTQIITTGAEFAKQRLPIDYTFNRKNDDFILGGKSGNNWFFQAAANTAITPTSKVDIEGENGYDQLRLRKTFTPANSADASGNVGDFAWDTGFVYIKVTGLGWTRAALATF